MGRWAQAARRGSAVAAKTVGEVPVMAEWTSFGIYAVANWTCSTNPLSFQVEVWTNEGDWAYFETLAATGVSRTQVSNALWDDIPVMGRVRAHWADGYSEWSDWLELVVS
jgi:hypothetical protein